MTPQDARAHYNYLLTLCLRKEESFGPLAFAFLKEHDLEQLGLTPEEQFNLYMATSEVFAAEPKRYNHKLECLQKASQTLRRTYYNNPELARQLAQEIQKTATEWELYNEAMRAPRTAQAPVVDGQRPCPPNLARIAREVDAAGRADAASALSERAPTLARDLSPRASPAGASA